MSCAREAATVDLPSLGKAEVIPITLFDLPAPLKSAAILIERMDLVKRDDGELMTHQNISLSRTIVLAPIGLSFTFRPTELPFVPQSFAIGATAFLMTARDLPPNQEPFVSPLLMWGNTATQFNCSEASTSAAVRNTQFDKSRSQAIPSPSISPAMPPAARMANVFGWLFSVGGKAAMTTRASVIGKDCC